MAQREPFFPQYRTVRTVSWWAPLAARVGLAILIVWAMGMVWLLLGGTLVPR